MSKSTYSHDVVATIGSYKDKQGNEKKNYVNIGKAFTNDQGQISIKLNTVPVGPEWSGWLSLYPVKEREQQAPRQSAPPVQRSMPPAPPLPSLLGKDEDDDIPF